MAVTTRNGARSKRRGTALDLWQETTTEELEPKREELDCTSNVTSAVETGSNDGSFEREQVLERQSQSSGVDGGGEEGESRASQPPLRPLRPRTKLHTLPANPHLRIKEQLRALPERPPCYASASTTCRRSWPIPSLLSALHARFFQTIPDIGPFHIVEAPRHRTAFVSVSSREQARDLIAKLHGVPFMGTKIDVGLESSSL